MSWRCRMARRRVRQLFVRGALSPRPSLLLWQHLTGCASCQAVYEQAMALDRISRNHPALDVVSPLELALLAQVVTSRLERPKAAALVGRKLMPPWWWIVAPAAAAAMVVAAVMIRPVPEQIVARDSDTARFAVRALCALEDVNHQTIIVPVSRDPTPAEIDACPAEAELHFAYRSPVPGLLYLAACDGADTTSMLVPGSLAPTPLPLPATAGLEPLPVSLVPAGALARREQVELAFVLVVEDAQRSVPSQVCSWAAAKTPLPVGMSVVIRTIPITTSSRPGGE